jgi:nucleotide-binding universal stress UspA family protein
MSAPNGPILFCFDGSNGSLHALRDGGRLLEHRPAVVLTVWETTTTELTKSGAIAYSFLPDENEFDAQAETEAHEAAGRGARVAAGRGWDVSARVENAPLSVWQTIIDVAEEIDACAIVCGARALNGLKRAVLGSVSEAVLHHARRPIPITRERRVG